MLTLLSSFVLGLALAVAFVPLCRVLARRKRVVAHPREDRWHRTTVPLLGGLGIGASILLGSFVTGIAGSIAVPLTAAMLMCAVGLVDDVLSLKPATKLIAQISVASALVYFGYNLHWFESRLLDSLLTIVWVVGLTNAFNLLDNMDGLCAGIALIVAIMLLIGLYTGVTAPRAGAEMSYLALLSGATLGFLLFNFPPASIFMGDGGSLLLGFSLAAFTLSPEGVRGSRADVISVITAPVFVLLIPIFDTTLVTALRLLSGRSPATGGRDHSSHRLVAIGLSERTAVLVLCSLAALGGLIGNTLRHAGGWSVMAAALFVLAMGLFAVYLARIKVYEDTAAAPAARALTPLVGEFLYKRRVAEVILDFCLITIAYYAAYHLRFEADEYLAHVEAFYQSLPVVLAAQLIAFFIVGVYRGMWRHFSLIDGVTITSGVLLGSVISFVIVINLYGADGHSPAVFVMDALLLGALVTATRASFRLMGEFVQRQRSGSRRAIIYGTAANAPLAIRELYDRQGIPLKVIGFVDDDPRIARTSVHGYPVLGSYSSLHEYVVSRSVEVVILNHALEEERLRALEGLCYAHSVSLLRLHILVEELVTPDGVSPATNLRAQLRSRW
jgi:UDP-GlcNAc:undecaprenyl-phosphate/decaprenyl-phosphate GlcNAc-1-phosphate transferase